jgi:steroid 5-alpha reductase family enzyme
MTRAPGQDPAPGGRARGLAALAVAYAAALGVALAVGWALRGRHPVLVAAAADAAATLTVFAFSVRHDNSSLYDPYWSVAPIPIVIYWAACAGGAGSTLRRAWLVVIVCLWGLRLTANQLARWRGLDDEDFRYVELRARAGRLYWPLSLAGIHLMPSVWVFLGLLAVFPAFSGGRGWGALDGLAALVAGGAVVLETVADRQLRRFLRDRRDPAAILDSGLWALSRHPNYLGELLFWWGLFLSGVAAAPGWAWTIVGPLAITVLFVRVSVPWMDRRMASRHPAWGARLQAVPALLPWRGRRR